jgi:hypothetical protein
MPRVRVRIPVDIPVTDGQLKLLQGLARVVQVARENAPALRTLGAEARRFFDDADKVLAAERKAAAARRRRRVR